jgi:hypothetical protein
LSKQAIWIISILFYILGWLIEMYIGVKLWNCCLINVVNVKEITPIEFLGLMLLGRCLAGTWITARRKEVEE